MANITMNAKDAISAKLAECFVTIENRRYLLMQGKDFEAKFEKTKKEIYEIISTYKEIKGTKHFTSTPVGYQYLISISIDLDGNMSTFESHEIADNLEKQLNKLPSIYLAIIHVNPV